MDFPNEQEQKVREYGRKGEIYISVYDYTLKKKAAVGEKKSNKIKEIEEDRKLGVFSSQSHARSEINLITDIPL
jgi:hypothetical protein